MPPNIPIFIFWFIFWNFTELVDYFQQFLGWVFSIFIYDIISSAKKVILFSFFIWMLFISHLFFAHGTMSSFQYEKRSKYDIKTESWIGWNQGQEGKGKSKSKRSNVAKRQRVSCPLSFEKWLKYLDSGTHFPYIYSRVGILRGVRKVQDGKAFLEASLFLLFLLLPSLLWSVKERIYLDAFCIFILLDCSS